ncbi:hypothetical protein [Escherichia coli]|nr:hypothetical protein [Escherichia coli]
MATKLKFIRLKIEDELIQPVNNLAGIRDELKAVNRPGNPGD